MPRSASCLLYFHWVPTYLGAGAQVGGVTAGEWRARGWGCGRWGGGVETFTLVHHRTGQQTSTAHACLDTQRTAQNRKQPATETQPAAASLGDQLALLKCLHQHLAADQRRVGGLQAGSVTSRDSVNSSGGVKGRGNGSARAPLAPASAADCWPAHATAQREQR